MTATPQLIPVWSLHDHPQNPRLALREDVVSAIVAGLSDGFDPAHALIVRPLGNEYQVLSGHHRKAAAMKAGIDAVPCWVRELDDEAAYMALVTSNSQGELSPLERGIHFNRAGVGVREYARLTGRSAAGVTYESQAGRVFSQLNTNAEALLEKTQHLAAIHALPSECWPDAVQTMLDKGWSAKETGEQVKAASEAGSAKVVCALLAGRCYMLPVIQLQIAWAKYGAMWKQQFANVPAPNRGYTTHSVAVPPHTLFPAIGGALRVAFNPAGAA